jgi:indole-3-glycerol phosphate synthase
MGFLAEVVASTRRAVSEPGYGGDAGRLPSTHPPSLRAAVVEKSRSGALLAEFKRRSPGAAVPDLPIHDPGEFVRRTGEADLAGYSCLATALCFGGSPADVARVASATARPVLFKDFVIDPAQVEAAARTGAAAVLLIARLETEGLLRTPLASLAERAHELGLEVVLEWHDRAELRRTESVPADVYGVNVRNLDTLAIERDTARGTLAEATGFRPLIGMSGVQGPAEAGWFWDAGVDGILVGTSLARAPEPRIFLESLRRSAGGAR